METNRKRLVAILLYPVLAIVVIAIVYFGTKQTYDAIVNVQQVRASDEATLATLLEKQRILLSADNQKLTTDFATLSNAIPETVSLPVILATLQSVSSKTQVAVSNFTLSSSQSTVTIIPLANNQRLSSFEFTITLDGNFDNIQSFITSLGQSTPLMSVKKIVFAQDTTKLTLDYYFQPKFTQKTNDTDAKSFPRMGAKEEGVMSSVGKLNPPVLVEDALPTSSSSGRTNPF